MPIVKCQNPQCDYFQKPVPEGEFCPFCGERLPSPQPSSPGVSAQVAPPVVPAQQAQYNQPLVAPVQQAQYNQPPVAPVQQAQYNQPPVVPAQQAQYNQPPVVPAQQAQYNQPLVVPAQQAQYNQPLVAPVQQAQYNQPPVAPVQQAQYNQPPVAPVQKLPEPIYGVALESEATYYEPNPSLKPILKLIHTESGREFVFAGQKMYIGRRGGSKKPQPEIDVTDIPHSERVSRPHAHIFWDVPSKNYMLVDNQSTNGTIVNGETLDAWRPYPLINGDIMELGREQKVKFMISIR